MFFTSSVYTTASITLPQGKWAVSATLLLTGDIFPFSFPSGNPLVTGESEWIGTNFSDVSTGSPGASPDHIAGFSMLISGGLTGPGIYGLANGTVIILKYFINSQNVLFMGKYAKYWHTSVFFLHKRNWRFFG